MSQQDFLNAVGHKITDLDTRVGALETAPDPLEARVAAVEASTTVQEIQAALNALTQRLTAVEGSTNSLISRVIVPLTERVNKLEAAQ